jgi:hypothetical protein
VEVLQGATGGFVRLVLAAPCVDASLVCFVEGNEELPVFLEDTSESLSGVNSERLDLLGVLFLYRLDDIGECLEGVLDGSSVRCREVLDFLVGLRGGLGKGGRAAEVDFEIRSVV